MTYTRLFRLCILGITTVFTFGIGAPATFAQSLNPPPPAFEVCNAVGSGTICRGSRTEVLAPEITDVSCGSGATAFSIIDSSTLHQLATRYYDLNGNLTRLRILNHFTAGQWSNALTGKTVTYNQNNVTVDVLAVPGDLASATETTTGEVIIRNGTGSPVLFATGRQVFSATGELISSAGRNAFVAAFFEGDPTALDDVCAALAQ